MEHQPRGGSTLVDGRPGSDVPATADALPGRLDAGSRRARKMRLARKRTLTALCFLAPWLIGVLVLQLYPTIMTIYYAFTNFDGINFPPKFIGLANFTQAFSNDPVFWTAVYNTIWWVVISVPATIVVGLALAVVLNRAWPGVGLYRTVVYLPSMVPSLGAGILFAWMFSPSSGPVDRVLQALGLSQPGWFITPSLAKPGMLLLTLWQVGPTMIIFLAGLQSIPVDLLEAALVDGCGRWRRFRAVVLPLLTPTVFFNLVLGMIGAFSLFTQSLAVSATAGNTGGQAGSAFLGNPNNSLMFYMVYMYQQTFQNLNYGYGSALSLLLTVVVALLASILFLTARRWVFYTAEQER